MLMTPDNRAAVLKDRLTAFVADRFPFALTVASHAFERAARDQPLSTSDDVQRLRPALRKALQAAIRWPSIGAGLETAPRTSAVDRLRLAAEELVEACDGVLWREAIALGLTPDERREILRGMVLTRATDNRLKTFFTSGEVKYRGTGFQGKGFRSLGQEAIYAAAMRLRRGSRWRTAAGDWQGDVVAPLIRDAAAALAMRPEPDTVRMILNAQMAKAGPPMDGRDLNIGDMEWGIVPAAAPLAIATMLTAGIGFAFDRQRAERVAVSFIGEGGASLGEWHEAINLCAVRRLPVVFCVQNNQTALSTPVADQSRVRVFADRAAGYGIPGITIDGTDPDAIAGAFGWAADRARAGHGPTLVELVSLRICGHAHHDDMLYLGKDPQPSWEYPPLFPHGYADPDLFGFWSQRDPIVTYSGTLEREGVIAAGDLDRMKEEAEAIVEAEAAAIVAAPWPDPARVTVGVVANDAVDRRRIEVLAPRAVSFDEGSDATADVEIGPAFTPKGDTFLEGVMLGVKDALASDPRAFVFGEDVGGKYGNAFLLLRPLLEEFGDRIVNAPLTEGGVLGVCIGAALAGLRPIGEMQFNDFVATGFNQLVNSAAKIRYRWGGSVPMVIRMPWGGLRHAGPYHSQNTEAWFYRTPGLKIVVPSTPHDARALMASAVADPDPVLYYEHIALYRDPRIKQSLDSAPAQVPIGKAALRRAGGDLAIVSYGAYVHVALRVAARLAESGIAASVLDLRSLAPLDRVAVIGLARKIGKVLIVHEDSRTGGIGESLAAVIQEEAFDWLDAPVRVIGALDTPVPYAPSLEEAYLPSEQDIENAARLLVAY
jgi:2-oxoisovalerate dehydrogenase E1 component